VTFQPPLEQRPLHDGGEPLGPVDASLVPRFAGPATFARLPRIDEVRRADVAIAGVPFDAGVSYRPGARFGPAAIRDASRLLRPYNPAQDVSPFAAAQVADAGDIAVNPFDIGAAITAIEESVRDLAGRADRVVTLGGDHTISLPLLRELRSRIGEPIALVHFDAHLDTWDTYFGAAYTHGTPFRRAFEEGLLAEDACAHLGTRGPLYARADLDDDLKMGFGITTSDDFQRRSVDDIAEDLVTRVGARPVYVSIDIDVLDPAHAPGTGTPEAGGLTSRELFAVLRGLVGTQIVGADVVEVAPAYDHAQMTAVAASHTVYELVSLLAAAAAARR
jgi:agmatinase